MSFWICLAVIKIIHEFGHGLTAKHFGGEVHEMGILFLVLTPALYCDVTDSWLLPNKWKRIWISAAGIYVECFLASIATFVWWYSTPGLLNSLAMATMFICSVNTILFNANPLLRYDGYYVMADWLEIPNLRIKSTQFFAYLFQEKVLGLEIPVQSYMPQVAAVPVRHLRGRQLHLSLVRDVRHPLVPVPGSSSPTSSSRSATCWRSGRWSRSLGMPVYQIDQVPSHAREDAQGEKGTCGRLRRGGVAAGHGNPADPDAAARPGVVRAQAGQARGRLRRDGRAAGRAQRQERPVGHQGHRAGQAIQPGEAEGADPAAAGPRRQLHQVRLFQA